MVGQPKSGIDMRQIMDQKKILIINLSKGRLGEDSSSLLGGLLITKLQLAAMSRVNMPESERSDFYMYVDEFQNFTTDSFATILSEARKYRLNLVLAHQYIAQLTEGGSTKIKNAVFGNVGTMICFRVGSEDSEILEREFAPVFTSQHLQNLNARQTVLKLSIDNASAGPFLAETLPPIFEKMGGRLAVGLKVSRERYGSPVEKVEDGINRWLNNQNPNLALIPKNPTPTDFDEIPDLPSIDGTEGEITNQNPEWSPASNWDDLGNSTQANLDIPTPKKKRRRKKKSANALNTDETDNDEDEVPIQNTDLKSEENQQKQAVRHPLMDKLELLKQSKTLKQTDLTQTNPPVKLYQPNQNPQPQTVNSKQYFAGGLATSFAINEYQNDDEDGFEIPKS